MSIRAKPKRFLASLLFVANVVFSPASAVSHEKPEEIATSSEPAESRDNDKRDNSSDDEVVEMLELLEMLELIENMELYSD